MATATLPITVDPDVIRSKVKAILGAVPEPHVLEANPDVKKVIVAVHGIGDQFRSETIQTVAHRFCRYMGRPAAIPLGQFYHPNATVTSAYVPEPEQVAGGFAGDIGFLEVYWAGIPREPVQEAHTLEDPKRWAHSIVERLQMRISQTRQEQAEPRLREADRRLQEAEPRLREAEPRLRMLHATASERQEKAKGLQAEADARWEEVREKRAEADCDWTEENREAAIRAIEVARDAEEAARAAEFQARKAESRALAAEVRAQRAAGHKERAEQAHKAWLKARRAQIVAAPPTDQQDFQLLAQVIEEMITGVAVAERLTLLATKMGLSHGFDLKKLLDDYLNDVQLVTEFGHYRERMLDVFRGVMKAIHDAYENSDIYIIAHSEGTVVSFLGLLAGLKENEDWIQKVRGYMTIGSPLNKHVILWPGIFEKYTPRTLPERDGPILWRNYYDYGDPIGFDLGPTREWMQDRGIDKAFAFNGPEDDPKPNHDHGFTRYSFPGAAHNEYWHDGHVFGHFIQEVVNERPPRLDPEPLRTTYGIPRTIPFAWFTSYILPYLLAAAVLLVAVLLLYKAVHACVNPQEAALESLKDLSRNVVGFACLIAGMTVMARLPRLTRAHRRSWRYWRIRAIGIIVFAGLASLFSVLVDPEMQSRLVAPLELFPGWTAVWIGLGILTLAIALTAYSIHQADKRLQLRWLGLAGCVGIAAIVALKLAWPLLAPGSVLTALAALVGVEAWILSRSYPELGLKPLLYSGGLVILFIVTMRIAQSRSDGAPPPDLARLRATSAVRETVAALRAKESADAEEVARRAEREGSDDARRLRDEASAARVRERRALEEASQQRRELERATAVEGPIWPVFLSGLASLYLWWLAALTFDLTFIWHSYIRRQNAQDYLRQVS